MTTRTWPGPTEPTSLAARLDRPEELYEWTLALRAIESGGMVYRWKDVGRLLQDRLDALVRDQGWHMLLTESGDANCGYSRRERRRMYAHVWWRDNSFLIVRRRREEWTLDCSSLDKAVVDAASAADLLGDALPSAGKLHVLGLEGGEMSLSEIGEATQPLVRENYTEAVLTGYDHAAQDLSNSGSRGRLVLLIGPPGTGKSYLVRGLVSQVDAKHVVVPQAMFSRLSDPSVIQTLANESDGSRPIVLILEDADTAILPRAADNIGILSTLLNVTDGVLGSSLNLRVVATTNSRRVEIDAALLRPGRLSVRIDVGPLAAAHARLVFRRIAEGKQDWPGGDATLAELYAGATGDG